jgi:hypothetical protein
MAAFKGKVLFLEKLNEVDKEQLIRYNTLNVLYEVYKAIWRKGVYDGG